MIKIAADQLVKTLTWIGCMLLIGTIASFGQGSTRYSYHDAAKQNLKEVYQVKDTLSNILNGRYISYFLNGNVESKGQFANNETTGVWEFYYETGNLKMRGILRQNSNFGLWEYFYESGQKSMEGVINEKQKEGIWKVYYENGNVKEVGEYQENKRTGLWKMFFEDGVRKGEIEYIDDHGRYMEYDHDGKLIAEGPRSGTRNVGLWKFYAPSGALEGEGSYENGKKEGTWKYFFPSGKISSSGSFKNDEPIGEWSYFFEDGSISSKGEFVSGRKSGYWTSYNPVGKLKSEITYVNGSGDYREYHPNGKLKVKGRIENGLNQGKWNYYFEDGKLEGECDFVDGKGIYYGYYPSGTLQTKGLIDADLRLGTWELYEQDGKLSGYYKPFYEDKALSKEINALVAKSKTPPPLAKKSTRKGFYYFSPLYPEYHGVILAGNPITAFVGAMPLGVEFYNQERLGHEFGFEGIRSPFFTADAQVAQDKLFKRGYAISIKEKFYNPMKTGMWYFGHEIRFANIGHYANVPFPLLPQNKVVASAAEQRAEYGVLLGTRLMKKNNGDGFTIDAFVGYAVGYRRFEVEALYQDVFRELNQRSFSQSLRVGLNFGYCLSFDGRR